MVVAMAPFFGHSANFGQAGRAEQPSFFVLSVVTALLLPPTLVVGVFGMNMQPAVDREPAWIRHRRGPGGYVERVCLCVAAAVCGGTLIIGFCEPASSALKFIARPIDEALSLQ